jgi:N-acetylneuraminic acid mutarotase
MAPPDIGRMITILGETMNRERLRKSAGTVILLACLFVLTTSTVALAQSGTWALTGSLHTARESHTATLLTNGSVVVAGGSSNNMAVASTEVYSPTTHAWSVKGNMNVARASAQARLLVNGRVLVAGGCTGNCLSAVTRSTELYNPTTGSWSTTGSLNRPRVYFGAVTLPNGMILAAGGCTALNSNGCGTATASAEIYNPATGTWTVTGSMAVARGNLSLTLLPNGKVLAAGGSTAAADALGSSELYDPATGKWTLTGKMNIPRSEHTATLLGNGMVLAAGGENVNGVTFAQAELYSPALGKWVLTGSMKAGRLEHTAVLLPNGNLLVSGGTKQTLTGQTVLASAELYNPLTGLWASTGSLKNARSSHTSTLLASGLVLDAAGSGPTDELISAELYTP